MDNRSNLSSTYLTGVQYFPIRKDLRNAKDEMKTKHRNNLGIREKIFIALGGGDRTRENNKLLAALQQLGYGGHEIFIAGDYCNKYQEKLNIRKLDFSAQFSQILKGATRAFIGAGLTKYEVAFMQITSLIFIDSETNLDSLKEFTDQFDAQIGCNILTESTATIANTIDGFMQKRQIHSGVKSNKKARVEIIDGEGANRILSSFLSQKNQSGTLI